MIYTKIDDGGDGCATTKELTLIKRQANSQRDISE